MRAYDANEAAQHHHDIHAHVPSEPALRVKALESLLVEKGLVDKGAIPYAIRNRPPLDEARCRYGRQPGKMAPRLRAVGRC